MAIMINRLEWFVIGFSGLFEIVLFLLLCQPINRRHVGVWLKWLVGGAALYHVGYFARLVLHHERTETAVVVDQLAMLLIVLGMLLMPSSMLHAALRLWNAQSGPMKPLPETDWRYGLFYLPLLLILPASWLVWSGTRGDFLASVAPLKWPYVCWLSLANLVSAVLFLHQSVRTSIEVRRTFFRWMGSILICYATGIIIYAAMSSNTGWESAMRMFIGVAPLVPSLLFVWYTLRNRLLPVVFEQSIVFGGILLTLLLLHRLIVTPLTSSLREQIDIDFLVVEVAVLAALVWWVRPLRRRASESLRFLMSPSAFQVRDATRQLALEVTQQTNMEVSKRCTWLAHELQQRFDLVWVRVICNDLTGESAASSKREQRPRVFAVPAATEAMSEVEQFAVSQIMQFWINQPQPLERGEVTEPAVDQALETLESDVAFPMMYKNVVGAVLFGSRNRFDRLADEQVTALSVLIDQFAATLQNQHDEELRRLAERRSLQQEKLSTLGLLSGSLAHELRNPLSSIRTIASLLDEETANESQQKKDLKLIVSEVDRLTQTLQRMLDFARPPESNNQLSLPDRIIARLLAIMNFYAQQHQTTLDVKLQAADAWVCASDQALNEIFMNLIKNGIEAASGTNEAKVEIQSHYENQMYLAVIRDNGIGIADDRIKSIFLPFETSKSSGTGLGLYIVSQRVKELGGEISVHSSVENGSCFEVRIPIKQNSQN